MISTRSNGKWTRVDYNNPEPLAYCDYSGMVCMQTDLVKQMEYRGTNLVFTGFYVNPRFADVPNPQNLTPILRADPEPVILARPDPGSFNTIQPPPIPPLPLL